MDLIFVLFVVGVYGSIKLYKSGGFKVNETPIMREDGQVVIPNNCRQIGNNLSLKCDTEAFTLILKELGLRR